MIDELRRVTFRALTTTVGTIPTVASSTATPCSSNTVTSRGLRLPFRDTWFTFYQPQPPNGTAYLYEFSEPVSAVVFETKVDPALRQALGRAPSECAIHFTEGESFANCDIPDPPWYNYSVRLIGHKVGRLYGPYGADDLVSPNKVVLLRQNRYTSNVRNVRAIVEFVATPSSARVQRHLQLLLRAAVEDGWKGGHRTVLESMRSKWGHKVLQAEGIDLDTVYRQFRLYRQRIEEL